MWCKKKGSGEKNCINREMKSQKKGIKIDEFFSNYICICFFTLQIILLNSLLLLITFFKILNCVVQICSFSNAPTFN